MTTSYTSLLGLALPQTGDLSGTWGTTVNDNITAYLDSAVAGTQIISGSLTAVTLSKTTGANLSQAGTGATGSSQYQIIRCTGNPAGLLTITAPAADKTYIIINATSTTQSVKIVGAGPTTGVTIPTGKTTLVAWNGSDFVEITPTTISGVLPVLNGGTGVTTSTGSGNVVLSTSPTLISPILGTPTSGTLTNCTGLPISSGVFGLAANVATFLQTPSSANLAAALTDKTGTAGKVVFDTNPTFPAQVTLSSTADSTLVVAGGLQLGGNTASNVSKITSAINWNFSPFSIVRAAANTATPRLFSLMLGGDSDSSTSIGDYNAIWGIYDSSPTSTSTSVALNGKMAYAAYAGHQWYVNNSLKMLVNSSGNFGLGGSASTTVSALIGKNITGGTVAYGSLVSAQVMTDVTNVAFGTASNLSLQTGSALGELVHYYANQSTVTGSTLTTQKGYSVESTLTDAVNNYGFYGGINASAGTTRYNLYMAGTADNYLAGKLGIGLVTPLSNCQIFTTGGQTTTAITTNTNVESFFIASHNSAAAGAGGGIIFGAQAGSFAAIKGSLNNGNSNTAGDLCFSLRASASDAALTERLRIDSSGNVGIGASSFGTNAAKVIGIANGTAPTTSPSGMGQLYVEGGALKYRGSSGTVTTIAAA